MAQRAALLALAALACLPAAGVAAEPEQPPGPNIPPVAGFAFQKPGEPVIRNRPYWVEASGSYDPDGWIRSMRWMKDGQVVRQSDSFYPSSLEIFERPGWVEYSLAVTDNDGAENTTSMWVNVLNQYPPVWEPPRPRFGPMPPALYVPRYYRTGKLNRHGLPVRVECAYCYAEAELQLTRYRARRLGLRGPFPRSKVRMVHLHTGPQAGAQHRFRLRPTARFRKALRRRASVPLLLKVRAIPYFGRARTITAEIELSR